MKSPITNEHEEDANENENDDEHDVGDDDHQIESMKPHEDSDPEQSNNNLENGPDDGIDDDDDDDDEDGEEDKNEDNNGKENRIQHENNSFTSPNSTSSAKKKQNNGRSESSELMRFADSINIEEEKETDPEILQQIELIEKATPTTELEIALFNAMQRKTRHLNRLTTEIIKLKNFISKRKQTYKRKRKDDGAPTRALSAYNIFIQERFSLLAKENEKALKSDNEDAALKRVPPAHLVAATGTVWKSLPLEEKLKYEERAKGDRQRYEEQMAEYQPPDKQSNRKRNKTGYNMFFTSHVLRLKQTDTGVPSERGSIARLVGAAWKSLSPDEKAYYENEADKHNGLNPVKDADDEEDEVDEMVMKPRQQQPQHHMEYPMPSPHTPYPEMHMHGGIPPPPSMHHAMAAQQHLPPDPAMVRHHHPHPYYAPPPPPQQYPPPPHMYAHAPPPPPPHSHPPYGHYDYSQHHQRHQARATQQGGGGSGGYQPQGYQPVGSSRRGGYEG